MSRVTTPNDIPAESAIIHYSDYFEELEAETEECRACYGSGLDRDEREDCPVCGGEGEIFLALRS